MSMMAGEGAEERGGVWSKVPDDIAASIFSRLTVYDIIRAACACRRFRSLTASHKFLCCLSDSPRPNLLLLAAPLHLLGSEWAYDPTLDAWIKLSLAFLQPSLPDFSYPVASSGGLLCFGSGRDFVVCNPITKSWRKLPKVPLVVDMVENGQSFRMSFGEDFEQAFGLKWDSITGTYEFVMINHPTSGWGSSKMISYSSSLLQWRGQPALVTAEPCKLQSINIVSCNSGFYSLWKKGSSLVVYFSSSSSEGIWNEIEAPDCSSTLLNAHLMDRHGSLYMVGGVGSIWLRDDMWERPTSIRIWKLDLQSKHWMEVTRMPSPVLHDFHQYIDFDQLKCCGKDDVIYLKSPSSGVLMYDFTMSAWKWLKDLDIDMDLGGLILEPSLSAAA